MVFLLNSFLYSKSRESFKNDKHVSHLPLFPLVLVDLCQARVPTFHPGLYLWSPLHFNYHYSS